MKIASLAKLHVNNINVELKYNVAKGSLFYLFLKLV